MALLVKNKFLLCAVLILACGLPLFAQGEDTEVAWRIMLARSSDDYPVTPGDVYTLAYSAGSTPVLYTVIVDNLYRVRISNLGVINGAGKTFTQLKREAEAVVTDNYPLGGAQLVLTETAVFRVFVKGEVAAAGEVSAWGLSRLSSLADDNLTAYTSVRAVSVRHANGQARVYDLFKAQRSGDFTQNPYLRPGDEVTFSRISRVVTISGAVRRPGAYELMPNENLKELIETYGDGLTPFADKAGATLVRYVGSAAITGDIIPLSEQDLSEQYALHHLDMVTIPDITVSGPPVIMELILENK